MDNQSFENRMRSLEYFHNLRLLPGVWVVIRVDGRSFSGFTESRFEKPFDVKFHDLMVQTAQVLLTEMQGIYAYTESDEISVLFPLGWDFLDRSLEKVVSISASLASATFTQAAGTVACFDSRVWLGASPAQVMDYFSWRQADAARCALNGWCYWTLRQSGQTAGQATATLEKQSSAFKHELLFQHGLNFNDLPLWQRRGTGLYWQEYAKSGYNPIRQEAVMTQRRRIKVDETLPMKADYRAFMTQLLETTSDEHRL